MKHISESITESIIGKRGSLSKDIPELQNHDIVLLGNDHYYIVLLDENEVKQTHTATLKSEISKGILVRYSMSYGKWNWQPLGDYDKGLKMYGLRKSGWLDVMEIYHSTAACSTIFRDHIQTRCQEEALRDSAILGQGGYRLVWER